MSCGTVLKCSPGDWHKWQGTFLAVVLCAQAVIGRVQGSLAQYNCGLGCPILSDHPLLSSHPTADCGALLAQFSLDYGVGGIYNVLVEAS